MLFIVIISFPVFFWYAVNAKIDFSRWVVFLSGLAHITLPNSTVEAYVPGGKHGAILALDTADVSKSGHITTYPSNEVTTSLEIPLGEEGVPAHRVLYQGPCKGAELSG